MTEARRRESWDHTSNLIAAIVNSQVGRTKPVSPRTFNPFFQEEDSKVERMDLGINVLKIFLPRNKRGRIQVNGERRSN